MLAPRTKGRESRVGREPRLARCLVVAAVEMAVPWANVGSVYVSAFRPAMSHGSHRAKPPITAAGHQAQPGTVQPKASPPHLPGR